MAIGDVKTEGVSLSRELELELEHSYSSPFRDVHLQKEKAVGLF